MRGPATAHVLASAAPNRYLAALLAVRDIVDTLTRALKAHGCEDIVCVVNMSDGRGASPFALPSVAGFVVAHRPLRPSDPWSGGPTPRLHVPWRRWWRLGGASGCQRAPLDVASRRVRRQLFTRIAVVEARGPAGAATKTVIALSRCSKIKTYRTWAEFEAFCEASDNPRDKLAQQVTGGRRRLAAFAPSGGVARKLEGLRTSLWKRG